TVHIEFTCRRRAQKITLAFTSVLTPKRFDRAVAQTEAAVRNGSFEIDADGATKSATPRTGAEGIVEAEKPGRGRTDVEIAMRAMPPGAERNFHRRNSAAAPGDFLGCQKCNAPFAET